jgi:Na+/H+ antiporter NhaD/arsenite permease-like protein
MKIPGKLNIFFLLIFLIVFPGYAFAGSNSVVILGRVENEQKIPVSGVEIELCAEKTPLVKTKSHTDGWFVLQSDTHLHGDIELVFRKRHYKASSLSLNSEQIYTLISGKPVSIGNIVIKRKRNAAFWITVVVFLFMLLLIGASRIQNALAALIGASLLLATSALGHLIDENLIVYGFSQAVSAVDWNVIFLIMGMMIIIAIVEGTGIFRWLAFFAYKTSKGRMTKLIVILMCITAVSSAFLDNVTTMLLMTPITIRIALAIEINPLVLLMPEIMAANVGGLSTMVGTPTNILIASYSGISFSGFLLNLSPGVIFALAGVVFYSLLLYRKELRKKSRISKHLLERLEKGAVILQPTHLKKAGWVGLGMLVLFTLGETLHIPPAVIALLGATSLLVWIKPDVEEMIEAVDWTTLIFFIALFMVIGALSEVGLIDQLAVWVAFLIGDNPILAIFVITWLSALISTIIPNIPFTATILPVIGFLSTKISGVDPGCLYFSLAVGAAMGGNGSLIGASANLVTSGIAERAGYPISFGHFFKVGFPALLISVSFGTLWLLFRYIIF